MSMMRAAVFEKQGSIKLREVPKPKPGVGEALIRVTLTTICGTDVHILRGEYPVRQGLMWATSRSASWRKWDPA